MGNQMNHQRGHTPGQSRSRNSAIHRSESLTAAEKNRGGKSRRADSTGSSRIPAAGELHSDTGHGGPQLIGNGKTSNRKVSGPQMIGSTSARKEPGIQMIGGGSASSREASDIQVIGSGSVSSGKESGIQVIGSGSASSRKESGIQMIGGGNTFSRNEPDLRMMGAGSSERIKNSGVTQRAGSKRSRAARSGLPEDRMERPKQGGKARRIFSMILAECLALIFIFSYGFAARRWNLIQRLDDWKPEAVENQNITTDLPQYQYMKGHWSVAIFGVDSRGSNVGKGTNADVNIVCDIDHDTGEIKLVSVFRDSYLNISDKNSYAKLNQAYFMGGPSQAVKSLNRNLDLNITDYVTFNWKAVADGINLLGGVDLEISDAEFVYINAFITETVEATGVYSTHLKKAGMNHLDGVQAVAYGRLRLMDTDYARTERQRKVIAAAFEKAKHADFATLNQLSLAVFPQVATSVSMSDLTSLVKDIRKYYIGETGGFPFARGDKNMGKRGSCVIPQTLESNVILLHQFLYQQEDYKPSNEVKEISSHICDVSGMYKAGTPTDPALAAAAAKAEKESGEDGEKKK